MTTIDIVGYISALCFFLGYMPQLLRTYRLKSVDDISVWMWWLTFVAYCCGLAYGMHLGKAPLIMSYLLGLGCTSYMLVMCYLYRDPLKDKARREAADVIRKTIKRAKEGEK